MTNSMFKKAAMFSGFLFAFVAFQACDPLGVRATGDEITMTFDETGFHGLDLSISAKAEVHVGSTYKVEVTCEETAMPYVETKVENGILKAYFSRNVYDVDHMKIVVTAPAWDHFDVNGSGTVAIPDTITGNNLNLDVSGSGRIDADAAFYNAADLDVSGSGDIILTGAADDLNCEVSGSGKVDCFDFWVENANVEVSGSGDAFVHADEHLEAHISGSGDVVYEGNPQINAHVSGSGNIRKH